MFDLPSVSTSSWRFKRHQLAYQQGLHDLPSATILPISNLQRPRTLVAVTRISNPLLFWKVFRWAIILVTMMIDPWALKHSWPTHLGLILVGLQLLETDSVQTLSFQLGQWGWCHQGLFQAMDRSLMMIPYWTCLDPQMIAKNDPIHHHPQMMGLYWVSSKPSKDDQIREIWGDFWVTHCIGSTNGSTYGGAHCASPIGNPGGLSSGQAGTMNHEWTIRDENGVIVAQEPRLHRDLLLVCSITSCILISWFPRMFLDCNLISLRLGWTCWTWPFLSLEAMVKHGETISKCNQWWATSDGATTSFLPPGTVTLQTMMMIVRRRPGPAPPALIIGWLWGWNLVA